ncbi:hypothetical protein O6H91_04G120200 [Diphasiastrum complanatum]|nr:hypothetical protein O6H91_04G120200 [Diphasiastrum complanatum]
MLENLQVKPRKMSVVSPKHFMCFVFATVLVSTCRAGRLMTAFSESTLGGVSTKPDTSTELGDVAMKTNITLTNPTFQVTTELKKPLNKLDAVESHEAFDCNDKSLECSRGLEIRELGDHVDYVYAEVKN